MPKRSCRRLRRSAPSRRALRHSKKRSKLVRADTLDQAKTPPKSWSDRHKNYHVQINTLTRLHELCSGSQPRFAEFCGLPYSVWISQVYRPIADSRHIMRYKSQRYQLPLLLRVFRMTRAMRGMQLTEQSVLFDQSRSTCCTDVLILLRIFVDIRKDTWLTPPLVDSDEYDLLRGQGDFREVPHAMYAETWWQSQSHGHLLKWRVCGIVGRARVTWSISWSFATAMAWQG